MKIAVPVKDDYQIDRNFEDCEFYQIFTLTDKKESLFVETTDAPVGCGFKSNIAEELEKRGVNILLAGAVANDAMNILAVHGIEVIRNYEGNATEQVQLFLADKLKDGACL